MPRFVDVASRHLACHQRAVADLPDLLSRVAELAQGCGGRRPSVEGRVKGLWSTYLKVLHRGTGFEAVDDLVGVRVLVDEVDDCYRVLHELRREWPLAGEVEDYIGQPKGNGYQSLHAVFVRGPEMRFEVQIRTRRMHEVCRRGALSHAAYKRRQIRAVASQREPTPLATEPPWLRKRAVRSVTDARPPVLAAWPRPATERGWLLLSVALVLAVGLADHLTGPAIGFAIFYLVPISLGTWWTGERSGTALAVMSTVVWWLADHASGPASTGLAAWLWNGAMRFGIFLLVVRTLAALHDALRREEALARTDHLTGMANARAFFELSQIEMDRARRYGHPLTMVFIDLDDFAALNSRVGHVAADEVLRQWSGLLRREVRSCDHLARLGGDEFAALLPETGAGGARESLARLARQLEAGGARLGGLTVSMGAVTFVSPPDTVEAMIREADSLMYSAKAQGKRRWCHEVRALGAEADRAASAKSGRRAGPEEAPR